MCSPMETHLDFLLRHADVGGHVDEVAKDPTCLGVGVAPRFSSESPVDAAGNDQQRHVEVDLHADGRRQRIDVEEPHGIGERVLDHHALSVACDELLRRHSLLVGQ